MAGNNQRLWQLESIRGFAAVYVFLHHFTMICYSNSSWNLPFRFGQEAVMLFFLMSGFVVYFATFTKGDLVCWRQYFIKRFRRIYPIYLAALALGWLSSSAVAGKVVLPEWGQLAGNVFMLQDAQALKPGVWFDAFHNLPLWSLSYEWWFYMLFVPVTVFIKPERWQKGIVFALSLLGYVSYVLKPNQIGLYLMYFIIWWAGVEMAKEYLKTGRVTIAGQSAMIGMLSLSTILWSLPVLAQFGSNLRFGTHPVLELRHIASAAVMLTVGLFWVRWRLRGFQYTLGLFAVFAPMTYAIYVVHAPILALLKSDPFLQANPLLYFIASAVLIIGIAYTLEVRLQPHFNRLVNMIMR